VGAVILFSERRRPRPLLKENKLCRRSQFSQMRRSRADLIMNAERFTRIDLDLKKIATMTPDVRCALLKFIVIQAGLERTLLILTFQLITLL